MLKEGANATHAKTTLFEELRSLVNVNNLRTHLGKMAFLIQRRAASCHCHHRHFMTTLTVLPPSLALLQLATQGQLKVCASCPVAQPNAASLGKACRL